MEAYARGQGAAVRHAPGSSVAVVNLDDAFGVRARAAPRRRAACARSATSLARAARRASRRGRRADSSVDAWGPARVQHRRRWAASTSPTCSACSAACSPTASRSSEAASAARGAAAGARAACSALAATRPLVVVDYAHTPTRWRRCCRRCAPVAQARGGRAGRGLRLRRRPRPGKRPLMGEIAARLADRVVVTTDNPRSEDPLAIIDADRAQASPAHCADRARSRARDRAARFAEADVRDVVLIAGKGHETYQEIAGRRCRSPTPSVARAALARREPAMMRPRRSRRSALGAPRRAARDALLHAASPPTAAACARASCSSRCAASASTATTFLDRRAAARRRRRDGRQPLSRRVRRCRCSWSTTRGARSATWRATGARASRRRWSRSPAATARPP